MIERLEATLEKYEFLEQELTKPEILSDIKKTKEYSKEMSSLEDIVVCYRKYKRVLEDIENTKEMVKDPDLGEMAKEELKLLEEEKTTLDQELEVLLIPKDPNDDKNVIVEIRAGAGGDEAALFAAEIYRMYQHYAESKRWKTEMMEVDFFCFRHDCNGTCRCMNTSAGFCFRYTLYTMNTAFVF